MFKSSSKSGLTFQQSPPTSHLPKPGDLVADDDVPATLLDTSKNVTDQTSAPIRTTGFKTIDVSGFVNSGAPGQVQCDDIRHNGTISYSLDQTLDDDLEAAISPFLNHPLVQKHGPGAWARFVGSSVWLPDHGVYFMASRISYKPDVFSFDPFLSFLRGQIFDSDWNEIKNYRIDWGGESVTFPTNFDIEFDYDINGWYYGPEDPRVILEDGVEGAEPIIFFNQVSLATHWKRGMWMYRPFSKVLNLFTIQGTKRPDVEKNWAPLFYRSIEDIEKQGKDDVRRPSKYVYFIYNIEPMHVLKCHLSTGLCRFTYSSDIPHSLATDHQIYGGIMRGGTQLVPVPLPTVPGTRFYVSIPRTHEDAGCGGAVYRPEIVVLAVYNGTFHWVYASEALDLMGIDQPYVKLPRPYQSETDMEDDEDPTRESTSPEEMQDDSDFQFPTVWDPCKENRIFLANSIASWDTDKGNGEFMDTMTITISLQDQTIQKARIRGILSLIQSIPTLQDWLLHDTGKGGNALWDMRWGSVARDTIQCSIETAHNYSVQLKNISDTNEKNLKAFISLNPHSNVAQKHWRAKALEAEAKRKKKAQEEKEQEEKEAAELQRMEDRYSELITKENERLEKQDNQIELSRDEEEQRKHDLAETEALEVELIGKSETYRKLFLKELERLEGEQARKEWEERIRKLDEKAAFSSAAKETNNNKDEAAAAVANDQSREKANTEVKNASKFK